MTPCAVMASDRSVSSIDFVAKSTQKRLPKVLDVAHIHLALDVSSKSNEDCERSGEMPDSSTDTDKVTASEGDENSMPSCKTPDSSPDTDGATASKVSTRLKLYKYRLQLCNMALKNVL